jgi:hypothetical protein
MCEYSIVFLVALFLIETFRHTSNERWALWSHPISAQLHEPYYKNGKVCVVAPIRFKNIYIVKYGLVVPLT